MKKRLGFTLVEILVVLAIIAILAALLFPAFNSARESGRQTNCTSNLQQMSLAVNQYRQNEGRFPDTIVDLMAEGSQYDNGSGTAAPLGNNAPGYLKSSQDLLKCPNDDTLAAVPRSSYGSLSKNTPTTPLPNPVTAAFTGDYSQYVWNYFGYRDDGFAYINETEANVGNGNGSCTPVAPCPNLVNPTLPYNRFSNPVKYSLSNKFAPSSTIITHCIHHRINTASNLNSPGELYDATKPEASANARDIVLRIGGEVKAVDVSQWKSADPLKPKVWQIQTP